MEEKRKKSQKFKRWKTVLDEYTPSKKNQCHKLEPLREERSTPWNADYSKFYRGKNDLSRPFQCQINLMPKIVKSPEVIEVNNLKYSE